MSDPRRLTEVAVGLVFDAQGRILLAQRPDGKPYAGWWEFPGGKLETGEGAAQALARELDEELGLNVHASIPWIVREHSYPHARVRLSFRRVLDFSGLPRSRERQAFCWMRPDAIECAPLLPATVPILAMLNLPDRCIAQVLSPAGLVGSQLDSPALHLLHAGSASSIALDGGIQSQIALLRQLANNLLLCPPDWPVALRSLCDGLIVRPSQCGGLTRDKHLLGVRVDQLSELSDAFEVDADFAVVDGDVSACSRDVSSILAAASMPVYLRCSDTALAALRQLGLHGRLGGHWPAE